MKRLAILLFLCALFFGLSLETQATLVRSMNVRELVSDAQLIVKGTVISKDTAFDEDESGMIVTYYTVKVEDWLKGPASDDNELVFKQVAQGQYTLGGNQIRQNLFFPEYEVGKTYVFFLPEAHARTGLLAPVGLQQGVFEVIKKNGQELVPQLKERARLLKTRLVGKKNKFLMFHLDSTADDQSYETLKTIIEASGE